MGKRERPRRDWSSLYHWIGRGGDTTIFTNHETYFRQAIKNCFLLIHTCLKPH